MAAFGPSPPAVGAMNELSEDQAGERRHRLSTLPLRSAKSALLLQHWLDIADRSLVPDRASLDPARMVPALPNMVLHQFVASDRIIIRLAGTEFYNAYGRELTGTNYLDLVAPERRERAQTNLAAVIDQPSGLVTTLLYITKGGNVGKAESLGLPLRGPEGRIDMAVYTNDELPSDARWNAHIKAIGSLDVELIDYIDIGAGLPAP